MTASKAKTNSTLFVISADVRNETTTKTIATTLKGHDVTLWEQLLEANPNVKPATILRQMVHHCLTQGADS